MKSTLLRCAARLLPQFTIPEMIKPRHPQKRFAGLLFVLAICALTPLAAFGSGSYCACMPKPPSKYGKPGAIDRDRFDLGQKIFNGKAAPGQGDATAQRTRLEALQAQLPEKVGRKNDLPAMAGKLSEQQLDALEYFVKQRYPAAK
jgi:hypothetical protein